MDRADVNPMLLQPFIDYNFPDAPGRYPSFSPIVTASREATENKNKCDPPVRHSAWIVSKQQELKHDTT